VIARFSVALQNTKVALASCSDAPAPRVDRTPRHHAARPGRTGTRRACRPDMLKRVREFSFERAQQIDRAGDAALIVAAAALSALVGGAFHWKVALSLLAEGATLWLLAAGALRQYDADSGRGALGDLALTLVMLAAVGAPMAAVSVALSRHVPMAYTARFLVVLAPAVVLLRARVVGQQLLRSRPVTEVLVVGTGSLGRLTRAEIDDSETRTRVLGYLRFDDEPEAARFSAPLLGTAGELEAALRERPVDEVYLASTGSGHTAPVQAAIRTCERLGVPFALPVCSYRLTRARPTHASAVADGYAHFTMVRVTPFERAMKRLFDIGVSAAAIVALSPLLVVIAALVKLTSRGPALFRQERVGLFGRRFQMLKFRSMVEDAEARKAELLAANEQTGPVFKMKRDPRVTPIGRLLRRYSVDELPQLLNVLRGDMSIVGPRPPLPSEVARYEGWQRRRLSVRPGLTCVWQVSGRSEVSFQDWMLLDMRYIDHWSFARDVGLILKTVPVVLTGRGAS
jgi:exopolysaccharide biosynthesis polyprenyl glycosylphosphotransferase